MEKPVTRTRRLDITPKTNIIRSQAHSDISWPVALGELVDNSFDAGASLVAIYLVDDDDKKIVTVFDNGHGCDDMEAMLQQGNHKPSPTTRLGRFGVGLTDTAWAISTCTIIESVCNGVRYRVRAVWSEVSRSELWTTLVSEETDEPGADSCTKITLFLSDKKNLPHKNAIDELGFYFSPAIEDYGCKIIIVNGDKHRTIEPHQLPPLTDVVHESFKVDGKDVEIYVGIVKNGYPNKRRGLIYQHAHRVLGTSSRAMGNYGHSRISGRVKLGDGWSISRNKEEVSEVEQDRLAAAIHKRCKHIFAKADFEADEIITTRLTNAVENRMNEAITGLGRRGRERRPRTGEKTGTVEPKLSNIKRVNVLKVDPAKPPTAIERKGGRSGKIMVEWSDSMNGLMGEAAIEGGRVRITLNKKEPKLRAWKRSGNILMISMCAMIPLAEKLIQPEYRGWLPVDGSSIMEAYSYLVSGLVDDTDGGKK